ncbi:MAG TPA: exodeoxyribonuclease VII small subunit [Candidatus Competibacteraceae bacterium]|nr:MAG: exodeoxyribonuclease VII small subunit [Candidatus Competibacteraceae bacterium]HOB62563.1 exodeoxyribonuclease VII small subunit [Candidatus Competibacteraceae bacterium]HQA26583.1 exodeoxyribonuclease VII small subunit [Candidatus Competibacteraceae bacterium]HQD55813.1 exodeoxyribonuclease VII small subunit [Candidatus Competibacteraceae bacterium]
MTAERQPPMAFETALTELENLVGQLEQGELPLEEVLQRFERGVNLVRVCQTALRLAEQKVEQVLERNGGDVEILPFGEMVD